jgi:hypothetical protein
MNPELRNWYLSNLGIVQYVPKGEESVALQFHSSPTEGVTASEESSGSDSAVHRTKASLVAGDSAKAQVASVLRLMDVNPEDAQTVEDKGRLPLTNIDRALTSVSSSVTFRLACWHPCDDLLVFNQLDLGKEPESGQRQLLGNILRAIGRLPTNFPPPELIDWPMGGSHREGLGESESDARTMLSVFLDTRIKKHGILWVLLMGEQASELLTSANKSYSELLGSTDEISGGAKVIVIRSLQEMLQDPVAKRQSWLAIQCLLNKN